LNELLAVNTFGGNMTYDDEKGQPFIYGSG